MQEIESLERNNTSHQNIILIGMPGVGKSTIGVILAKVLGADFIDSDLVIQNQYHKRLKDIISEDGLDGFLRIEEDVNATISPEHAVIATGGSVIYGPKAMEHFQSIGTIVYLRIDYDYLLSRLGDLDERGVAHRPNQTLLDLYHERCVLYEKYADITIDETDLDIERTVNQLKAALGVN
ncbi:MAG: shikimate kinase [Lachnospiraceae bacterium]|nr:shikimate kinase [Lachnospiraceae bacterium]